MNLHLAITILEANHAAAVNALPIHRDADARESASFAHDTIESCWDALAILRAEEQKGRDRVLQNPVVCNAEGLVTPSMDEQWNGGPIKGGEHVVGGPNGASDPEDWIGRMRIEYGEVEGKLYRIERLLLPSSFISMSVFDRQDLAALHAATLTYRTCLARIVGRVDERAAS